MRVTFIAQEAYKTHGGIQRFNRRVVDALADACAKGRCVASVFILNEPDPDIGRSGMNVFGFNRGKLYALWRFVKDAFSSDVLVLGHINLLPVAILYKIVRPSVRCILFGHGVEVWAGEGYRDQRWWEPLILRSVVGSFASVSEYTAERFSKAYRFPRDRCVYFPNAVDVKFSDLSRKPKTSPITILTVSRLAQSEREKRVDMVIKAVALARGNGCDLRLDIVGDGELRVQLERLAKDLSLDGVVRFHGFVDESTLSALYRGADIFALPSTKEGFGIVYLEAWMQGVPVVGARARAVPEVIADGVDGYLVEQDSERELADRFLALAENSELRDAMVRSGRTKIMKNFSHEMFVQRFSYLID